MRSASRSSTDASGLGERAVQVVLHVARARSAGPPRSARAQASAAFCELGVGHDAVHEAERSQRARVEALGGEQDLARARRADEPRQEPARSVVAREAEPRVGGRHERRSRRRCAGRRRARARSPRPRPAPAAPRASASRAGAARAGCRAPSAAARLRSSGDGSLPSRAMRLVSPPAQKRGARAGQQHAADLGIGAERRESSARAPASSPSVSALRASGRFSVSTPTRSSTRHEQLRRSGVDALHDGRGYHGCLPRRAPRTLAPPHQERRRMGLPEPPELGRERAAARHVSTARSSS